MKLITADTVDLIFNVRKWPKTEGLRMTAIGSFAKSVGWGYTSGGEV